MKYTSAEAGKLLKKLENQINDLVIKENKAAIFNAAAGEDAEALRPKYSFSETQKSIAELQKKVRKVKHAINVFNTTHELPGHPGVTIDQALVLIPQLTKQANKLHSMASALPRERVASYGRSNIIDYVVANYDIAEAEKCYNEMHDELVSLQLALDKANTTETMEIDVE